MITSEGIRRFLQSAGGNRKCVISGKTKYRTKAAAANQASSAERKLGKMSAYLCKICGEWHFGHEEKRTKRK